MRLIPSRALVLLGLVPLGLAAAMLADQTLRTPLLLTDGGIVVIALIDALLALRPLAAVERRVARVLSIGRPNAVTLEVRSRVGRALRVWINDDLFSTAECTELPLQLELPARGRQAVRYHLLPRQRGSFVLGDHHLRYRSPLGLWIRQQRIVASDAVHVYPDVQAVRTFELLAQKNREAAHLRTSRQRGGESEFERLREYRRGDEYRSIDWKGTARRQKLISREYQLESNQNLMFLLDSGRLMTAETAGLSLFDHALNSTLMLSHVAARGGDNVGLMVFDNKVRMYAPPTGGANATARILKLTYDLHPALVETNFEAAFAQLGIACRKRSLIVLFTQIVDEVAGKELLRLLRGVKPRHLPILILFRDSDVDELLDPAAGPPSEVNLYVRAAAAELTLFRDKVVRELRQRGALVLDVPTRDLTPALLNRYLEVKAQHLL